MIKKLIITLLGLFFLYDTFRSFNQHLHMPLDGDIALIVLPAEVFKPAMKDLFGIEAAFHNKYYHATNRAFAHWTMCIYFQTVPFFFQLFSSPLDSVYLSAALAKILFQLLICYMLARYAKPHSYQFSDVIIGMAILTPLFQTGGFNSYMGVIDQSITYAFFYALPIGLLLVFFYPFYRYFLFGEVLSFSVTKHILYILFMLFISFNGSLSAAIAATTILCIFGLHFFYRVSGKKKEAINPIVKLYLLLFGLISAYSIYVGSFNAENFSISTSINMRYTKLLIGLREIFFGSVALPILSTFMIINAVILRKNQVDLNIRHVFIPIIIFCLTYLVLLPFGGYRIYRPNILRYDTALPLLICGLYLFQRSTLSVLALAFKFKVAYIVVLAGMLLFFHFSDSHISARNTSEKKAILEIVASDKHTVVIHDYCSIMAYRPITDSLQSSPNTQLLQRLGVLDRHKLYYQKY